MTAAEQTWGSDSPHVEKSLDSLNSYAPAGASTVVHALLAVADELAEQRRRQHADAIDLANAVATLTGAIEQPERVYVATHMTWWGHLRALFGGAR